VPSWTLKIAPLSGDYLDASDPTAAKSNNTGQYSFFIHAILQQLRAERGGDDFRKFLCPTKALVKRH
jgi:hypothetical protein